MGMWLVEATRSQPVWSSRWRNWGGNSARAGSDWLTHRRCRQLLGIHSRMEAPSPLSPYPPPRMLRLPCRWLLDTEPPTQRIVLFHNNTRREVKSLSRVWLFVTPWTTAYQGPPPMGFPRQDYQRGLPFPSPGESSWPRDRTQVSCIAGRCFTLWVAREDHQYRNPLLKVLV